MEPATPNEWDETPATSADHPARRAAVMVWVLSAVCLVVFGCLGTSAFVFSRVPHEELQRIFADNGQEIAAPDPKLLSVMALMMVALGVLPGIVYLIAGFGVRAGRSGATNLALYLVITQVIIFGLLMLNGVIGALLAGDPASLTMVILPLGTLLAIMGFTIRWLISALRLSRSDVS